MANYKIRTFILFIILLQQTASANWLVDGVAYYYTQRSAQEKIRRSKPCLLSAEEAYTKSIQLLSDGCQGEAEDLIESALKTYPNDPEILFAHAVLLRSRWYIDESAVWLKVLKRKGGSTYLARAARLNLTIDQNPNAQDGMPELIQLSYDHPDDIYLLWLSALQCRHRDMGDTAREQYEKLLSRFTLGPVLLHQTYGNILSEELNDPEAALPHRQQAAVMEPKHWTLSGLAETLVKLNRHEEANAVYARLMHMYPDKVVYVIQRSQNLTRMGRDSEADEFFQSAIELAERQNDWYYVAFEFRDRRKYSDAIDAAKKALTRDPDEISTWLLLAACYKRNRQPEEALEILRKIVAVSPTAKQWNSIADIYAYNLNEYEQGIDAADKALQLDPEYGWAWSTKGDCFNMLRRYADAVHCYEKAVEYNVNHCAMELGESYLRGRGVPQDGKKAFKYFQLHRQSCLPAYQTMVGLAQCYHKGIGTAKNEKKAIECYVQAIQQYPTDFALPNILARLYATCDDESLRNYPEAIRLAQRSIKLEQREDNLWTLAIAYERNGQLAEAKDTHQRIITLMKQKVENNPNNAHYLNNLAWYYATCKNEAERNYPEAVRLAERSVQIEALDYNLDTLVIAYEGNSQVAKALATQKRFMKNWQKNHPDQDTPSDQQERLERLQSKLDS